MASLPPREVPEWTPADRLFMMAALEQAQIALAEGEVPVGCVIVKHGEIVARGGNKTNATRSGIRHAEFIAIDKLLEQHEGDVDAAGFPRCELYVTCEPCIMCAGALSLMGFGAVTYGCLNDKFGGNGGIISVSDLGCGTCTPAAGPSAAANGAAPPLPGGRGGPYRTRRGLLAEEAVKLLQDFYIAGNPNAPKPHRPLRVDRRALQSTPMDAD